MIEKETWRTITVEGVLLSVSNTGRVKKLLPRERELAPFKRPGSCAYVRIFDSDGKYFLRSLARMVAEAHMGVKHIPKTASIGHRNGNRMDCSVENIILPDETQYQPYADLQQDSLPE